MYSADVTLNSMPHLKIFNRAVRITLFRHYDTITPPNNIEGMPLGSIKYQYTRV
jgi:hypothetical protein